ncbi:MAG: hypothetical protein CMN32_04630 [Saprospirales bacterium]|nr:hypothetical protein [Saprospirales bacterium]
MPYLFHILRGKNLLIVAATQYLIRYFVLLPVNEQAGHSPALPAFQFFLLVLDTVLIAAAGYVVNDLLDAPADAINKPGKNLIASKKYGWRLYGLLVFSGLAIALYLAFFVGKPLLVLIYPAAVLGLWWYSNTLKHLPLAGNLTVALFCGLVIGIVLFAERESLRQLPAGAAMRLWIIAGGYAWFAFLTTLLREIAKDAEDLEGDRQAGSRTIATAWGLGAVRNWLLATATLILLSLLAFSWWLWQSGLLMALFFCVAMAILPVLYLLRLLPQAKERKDFTRISRLTKWIMVAGLLLIITLWIF